MKLFIKRMLLTLGALMGLLITFHLVENWRGRRAWETWKASQEASGFRYDVMNYEPRQLPDADNFAKAPIVVEITSPKGSSAGPAWLAIRSVFTNPPTAGNFRLGQSADYIAFSKELDGQNLETVTQPFDSKLDQLAEAARRPGCRFMADYADIEGFPPLLNLRAVARALRLRALARLQAGKSEAALEDVLTGLKLIQNFKGEPHLISQLLRLAYVGIFLQPVWEGLQAHAWNEAQLVRLEAAFAPIDTIASMDLGWGFERAGLALAWTHYAEEARTTFLGQFDPTVAPIHKVRNAFRWAFIPKGWIYQNLVSLDREFVAHAGIILDQKGHLVHADKQKMAEARFSTQRNSPYNWIARMTLPALLAQNARAARAQSDLDMARMACALERHRLALGAYPDDLEALGPFLAQVPHDVINGTPLHYRRQGDGFRLYSVGWNGTDEGGQVAPVDKDGSYDPRQGDWVWSTGK